MPAGRQDMRNTLRSFKTPAEVVRLTMDLYVEVSLSMRQVEGHLVRQEWPDHRLGCGRLPYPKLW